MKQFVKALNKDSDCFRYIVDSFPKLSDAKIEAGVFDGPKIRKLMKDSSFRQTMSPIELESWDNFVSVSKLFLGNARDENYSTLVKNMIDSFGRLGCNMSIKLHFLADHLELFPPNCGDVSDEQGERFHQDLRVFEERYQGKWDETMMADYCWSIKRDDPGACHRRKSRKRKFLPEE